jgi:hypothetical protein
LIQVFQTFVQQPFQFRRHHHFHALAAGLMLAQRFQHDFIRTFVAAGSHRFGNVVFEISRQGDVHGSNLVRGENVSTCIVRGLHKRAVIRTENFSRRVKEKLG